MDLLHPRIKAYALTYEWGVMNLPISFSRFPGGEVCVKIETPPVFPKLSRGKVAAVIRSSDDLMAMLLVTDALRRVIAGNVGLGGPDAVPIDLHCPYLPYARQDRVCSPGESLSLEVMANIINYQSYASVTVWDLHGFHCALKIANLRNTTVASLIPASLVKDKVLVCPDKGAVDRVREISSKYGNQIIALEKERDPLDGHITMMELDYFSKKKEKPSPSSSFLVIDDICDGGRTFLEASRVLRKTYGQDIDLQLWVTHGIFSAGFADLAACYSQIHCAHCFLEPPHPSLLHIHHGDLA